MSAYIRASTVAALLGMHANTVRRQFESGSFRRVGIPCNGGAGRPWKAHADKFCEVYKISPERLGETLRQERAAKEARTKAGKEKAA